MPSRCAYSKIVPLSFGFTATRPETLPYAARGYSPDLQHGEVCILSHHCPRVRHSPCVTGVDEATTRIRNGQTVLVDGFRGEVMLDPMA